MATRKRLIRYRRDTCLCGCGQRLLDSDVFTRHGHSKRVLRSQWKSAFEDVNRFAPQCLCGCGQKTRLAFTDWKKWCKQRTLYAADYAEGHCGFTTNQSLELTELERQAILGTLLGDSSIGYPHDGSVAPRLYSTHGYVQKEWADHKASFLHRLSATTRVVANAGWGEQSVCTSTGCNPSLVEIYDLVTQQGEKRVSRQWLDGIGDIGLAWWICDDGSASAKSMFLHTEGFSKQENELIAEWFCDNIGKATVCQNKQKKAYLINIASWTQIEVGKRVSQYIPECMRYKLVACDENRPRKPNGRIRHRSRRESLLLCEQYAGS